MPQETLNIFTALIFFGIAHSLLAAIGIKAFFVTLMGQRAYLGLYRLFYNTLSGILFAPILLWLAAEPGEIVWQVGGLLTPLFLIVQGIGIGGLLISFVQIDGSRFLGLRQLSAYMNAEPLPLPPETMSLRGVYGFVRHPLYLFSMFFIWFPPIMSASMLGLALGSTLYFVLGSLLEERKLLRQFGETYRHYQKEVPWMIPFVKLP